MAVNGDVEGRRFAVYEAETRWWTPVGEEHTCPFVDTLRGSIYLRTQARQKRHKSHVSCRYNGGVGIPWEV